MNIDVPLLSGSSLSITVESGDRIFMIGANGSGKSALLQHIASSHREEKIKRIIAHRQTAFNSERSISGYPDRENLEREIRDWDRRPDARWMEDFQYGQEKQLAVLSDLTRKENFQARSIRSLVLDDRIPEAKESSLISNSPFGQINELFKIGNLSVSLKLSDGGEILAFCEDESKSFSIVKMSDGERSAIIIAATVLSVDAGTMLLIDEPERHLHRSIIEPFLSTLFKLREDCTFIIATHEVALPVANKDARTLVIHSCEWNGQQAGAWDVNILEETTHLPEELKQTILGGRRRILFVEGVETSLDKPLYSLIFPMVAVIPKGSCHEVEQAVSGLRDGAGLHWLEVFGIVDGDGLDPGEIAEKRRKGVYTLPYYSVEAIYFHPRIIKMIAMRKAEALGGVSETLEAKAIAAGVNAVSRHTDRLSRKVAKKTARKKIIEQLPNDDDLLAGEDIKIANDAAAIYRTREAELKTAVDARDWETILTACPVRETEALDDISKALGFLKVEDYELAVRRLLSDDPTALEFVQGLFGDLPDQVLS